MFWFFLNVFLNEKCFLEWKFFLSVQSVVWCILGPKNVTRNLTKLTSSLCVVAHRLDMHLRQWEISISCNKLLQSLAAIVTQLPPLWIICTLISALTLCYLKLLAVDCYVGGGVFLLERVWVCFFLKIKEPPTIKYFCFTCNHRLQPLNLSRQTKLIIFI